MEQWQDQGIVLSARQHGENGAIVSLLTLNHGRHAGYVRGGHSSKQRGTLEIGNLVDVTWSSRVSDALGNYKLELSRSFAARFMQDPLRLAALQSLCCLCDQALPEREGHPELFHGVEVLLEALEGDLWGVSYVMWEVALLRELGFTLDLGQCAGGGDADTLMYVSPKSGRAVSAACGAPYKDKLLLLPDFLKAGGACTNEEQVLLGMKMTRYFLEHWVFAHHSRGCPEGRQRFQLRFEQSLAKTNRQKTTLEEDIKEHVAR